MADAKDVPGRVEKIMSITLAEFEAGLARLDATAPATEQGGVYQIPNAPGVAIAFGKLEPAVLGGVMRLPRARVTLQLEALDGNVRAAFLALFDRTFQRGGG